MLCLLVGSSGWATTAQTDFGVSLAAIQGQTRGEAAPGSLQSELFGLWTWNPEGLQPDGAAPTEEAKLHGLSGGITWAWDPTLCNDLMPRFREDIIFCTRTQRTADRSLRAAARPLPVRIDTALAPPRASIGAPRCRLHVPPAPARSVPHTRAALSNCPRATTRGGVPDDNLITCADVKASVARAFGKWAANNRRIDFVDVTEECAKLGMQSGAPNAQPYSGFAQDPRLDYHGGCPLAELWVTKLAASVSGSGFVGGDVRGHRRSQPAPQHGSQPAPQPGSAPKPLDRSPPAWSGLGPRIHRSG